MLIIKASNFKILPKQKHEVLKKMPFILTDKFEFNDVFSCSPSERGQENLIKISIWEYFLRPLSKKRQLITLDLLFTLSQKICS